MTRIPFDSSFEPPAPVLPVHIGSIGKDGPAAMLLGRAKRARK